MTGGWSSSLTAHSLDETERCLKKGCTEWRWSTPHLLALLDRHGVDASDCDANIYIFDGGYDYDLGGVVLTTTW